MKILGIDKRYFMTFVAVMSLMSVFATDISVESPGELRYILKDKDVSNLKISGVVNAEDIYWIGKNLSSLDYLDLSGSKIVAYKGDMLNGRMNYPAATIPAGAFAGMSLKTVSLPAATTVEDMAFASTAIESLPTGTGSIGMAAFADCKNLTSVIVPNNMVGAYAFNGCTALAEVSLQNMTTIPDGMFNGCTAMTTVKDASRISTIGAYAFRSCTSLKNFDFSSLLTYIGEHAFAASGLTEVLLDKSPRLSNIGGWAFATCSDLNKVVFNPAADITFGEGVFFDDKNLASVQLPERMSSVPDYMLKGSLAAITNIPEGVDNIGVFAFKDDTSVIDLTLPSTLVEIGTGAMEGTTGLKGIHVETLTAVPSLGEEVWKGIHTGDVTLWVSENNSDSFKSADQWRDFNIKVDSGANDIMADGIEGRPAIQGRFVGTDLVVSCTGADINMLVLYDAAGIMLTRVEPSADIITVDTAGFATNLYIIAAHLADGTTATLKLARH